MISSYSERKILYDKVQKKLQARGMGLSLEETEPFFDHDDPILHCLLLRLLGMTEKKENFLKIAEFVSSPSVFIRASAANALGNIKDNRGIKPLLHLIDDKASVVRWEALLTLIALKNKDALRIYLSGLSHEDAYIRIQCAEVLGDIPDGDSLSALHSCCRDPSPDVRMAVIRSLITIGSDSSTRFFSQAIADSNPMVRSLALTGLSRKPEKKLIAPIKSLLNDDNSIVRMSAIKALETCGYSETVPLIEKLTADQNIRVKANAILALGRMGSYRHVKHLIRLADTNSSMIQAAVARSLGELGYSEALRTLTHLVKSKNRYVRSVAASAIYRFNEQFAGLDTQHNPSKSLSGILEDIQSGDVVRTRKAMEALTHSDLKSVSKVVLEHIATDDLEVNRLALRALVRSKIKGIMPQLSSQLSSPHLTIRAEVSNALYHLRKDHKYTDHWITLMGDSSPSLRAKGIFRLSTIHSPNVSYHLSKKYLDTKEIARWGTLLGLLLNPSEDSVQIIKHMLKDPCRDIAFCAAAWLGENDVRSSRIISVLLSGLDDKDLRTRKEAARILAILQPVSGIFKLTKHIGNPDVAVRRNVITAMQNVTEPNMVAPLIEALKDTDALVRTLALRALVNYKKQRQVLNLPLRQALKDKHVSVLCAALQVVEKHVLRELAPSVTELLKSHDVKVRYAALSTLKILNPPSNMFSALSQFFQTEKNVDNKILALDVIGVMTVPEARNFLKSQLKNPIKTVRKVAQSHIG